MATTAAQANPSESATVTVKPETVNVGDSLAKTMPSLFGTTEGQVQFNIAVKVNMGEFATWQADRGVFQWNSSGLGCEGESGAIRVEWKRPGEVFCRTSPGLILV